MSVVINGVKAELATAIEYVNNPKRTGKMAWTRYETYQEATTIGEYFELTEKKYAMADLRYDLDHEFLIIETRLNLDEAMEEAFAE